jgi:anti-sigma B factor antagonist
MNLNFYEKNKVGILEIVGRLDAYNSPDLKSKFEQVITHTPYFIFDMHACEFIDSTGLGMIVACLKAASMAGGDIRLVKLQDKPKMVFDITRAYRIFQFFEDIDSAIDSYELEISTSQKK